MPSIKWTAALAGFLLLSVSATAVSSVSSDPSGIEFFEKRIRPILAQHCYGCHSHEAQKLKAGLYLDSRDGVLRGGDTGVAVVLGEPDKSRLIEAVRYTNPDLQMPPKQKLPESAIAALAEWVAMGAPWPVERGGGVQDEVTDQGTHGNRDHWAWRPIGDPVPPSVRDSSWPQTRIDRFILAALEAKGISPVGQADRRTLIRRAYFDLIGLPPSPEEVQAFVEDQSAEAFARVIDRLLASPHYGERFGRDWLDVARYGEDQAHNFKPRLYPQGFRYRDWVVQALNRDMPYDRFVMEQIAGDLMDEGKATERLPALGFFALGPVYYGDRKMFDQLDDRIDTLTRGFLGLTVACARCHDHKYDPITTQDYYALAGVFASSEYVEAPLASKEIVEAYERGQNAIEEQTKAIDAYLDQQIVLIAERELQQTARYLVAAWKWQNQKKADPGLSMDRTAKDDGLTPFFLQRWIRYLSRPEAERSSALAKWFQLVKDQELSGLDPGVAEVRACAEHIQRYAISSLNWRKAMEEHRAASAGLLLTQAATNSAALDPVAAAFLDALVGKDGVFVLPKNQVEKHLDPDARTSLAQLREELELRKRNAPAKYPFAHALKEGEPKNLPVLLRGNAETPGDEVPRRFLSLLSGADPKPFSNGSGRLELARAIADPENPLTARVMVNRIWQHHFGRGLVRTASNFGTLGEHPTHPDLLDFLSREFIASGWSLKALHRAIMLSAVYQLSSELNEENYRVDPENRLLWRMNRRRLEVEAWRDAMLAASGTLDRTIGGPSIDLASPDNRRRTLYAAISRHELNSLLRLFDFPDPNVTADRRTVTTVPLQQLFVLNSEFMVRQAKALAARVTDISDGEAERVRKLFLLVYGRPPGARELRLGLDYLSAAAQTEAGALTPWEQYAQVLLSANEFMYVD